MNRRIASTTTKASGLSTRRGDVSSSNKVSAFTVRLVLGCIFVVVVLLYVLAVSSLLPSSIVDTNNNNNNNSPQQQQQQQVRRQQQQQQQEKRIGQKVSSSTSKLTNYDYWRKVAQDLAQLPPKEILQQLEQDDPFGTRQLEKSLIDAESKKGAFLTLDEFKRDIFSCPNNNEQPRISLPDRRDTIKAEKFRNGQGFLYFQHLRKAGGTNFCTLAEENFPKEAIPRYYCMPDYYWIHDKTGKKAGCAGCLRSWSNEEIIAKMGKHRIAGNEWDPFDIHHHFDLPAAFVTSFRRPIDRALSQFRFECMEDRGCKIKDPGKWWKKRQELHNVYMWTFTDVYNPEKKSLEERAKLMGTALDVITKFHLVLAMEWLAYASSQVKSVLGFQDTSSLTRRVRPHNTPGMRQDGQEENKLGAAGIAKASWNPKEYLTLEQYKDYAENLALDEILTDAAHRLFLERLVCDE